MKAMGTRIRVTVTTGQPEQTQLVHIGDYEQCEDERLPRRRPNRPVPPVSAPR